MAVDDLVVAEIQTGCNILAAGHRHNLADRIISSQHVSSVLGITFMAGVEMSTSTPYQTITYYSLQPYLTIYSRDSIGIISG